MVGGGVALKAAAFVAAGVVVTGVGYEGARELSPPSRGPEAVVPATTAAVEPAPIVTPVLRAPVTRVRAAAATEKQQKAREPRGRAVAPGQVSRKAKAVPPGRAKKQPAAAASVRAAPPGQLKRVARAKPAPPGQAKKAEPKPKSSGHGRP